jgi:hypothetical protein
LTSIEISKSVEILGESYFKCCKSLRTALFESDSQLTRIESEAFAFSSLQSFDVLECIAFLDGSAFAGFASVSVSPHNRHFSFSDGNIVSSDGKVLIRRIRDSETVVVSDSIEVLGRSCFAHLDRLVTARFGENSCDRLLSISAFELCSIQSIAIPRQVQTICAYCFASCLKLASMEFESDTELERIEDFAFA